MVDNDLYLPTIDFDDDYGDVDTDGEDDYANGVVDVSTAIVPVSPDKISNMLTSLSLTNGINECHDLIHSFCNDQGFTVTISRMDKCKALKKFPHLKV